MWIFGCSYAAAHGMSQRIMSSRLDNALDEQTRRKYQGNWLLKELRKDYSPTVIKDDIAYKCPTDNKRIYLV